MSESEDYFLFYSKDHKKEKSLQNSDGLVSPYLCEVINNPYIENQKKKDDSLLNNNSDYDSSSNDQNANKGEATFEKNMKKLIKRNLEPEKYKNYMNLKQNKDENHYVVNIFYLLIIKNIKSSRTMKKRINNIEHNYDNDINNQKKQHHHQKSKFLNKKTNRTNRNNNLNNNLNNNIQLQNSNTNVRYDSTFKKFKSKLFSVEFSNKIRKFEKEARQDRTDSTDYNQYIKQIINIFNEIFVKDTKKETNKAYFNKTMGEIIIDIFTNKYQESKEKTVKERKEKFAPPKKKCLQKGKLKPKTMQKNPEQLEKLRVKTRLKQKRSKEITKSIKTGLLNQYFNNNKSLLLLNKEYSELFNEFINSDYYTKYYALLTATKSEAFIRKYDIIVKNYTKYIAEKKLIMKNYEI